MSNRTILIPILLFLLLCACAAPQKARDTTKEATTVTTNPSPRRGCFGGKLPAPLPAEPKSRLLSAEKTGLCGPLFLKAP